MPARTNDFQRLVAMLHATVGRRDKATVIESKLLVDRITKKEREVDVVISTTSAGCDFNISVEVVSRSRPMSVTWVEGMLAKHQNLDTDRLILVSKSGFTVSALEKAKFYRIETVTLQEAFSTDWSRFVSDSSQESSLIITKMPYIVYGFCTNEDGSSSRHLLNLDCLYPVKFGEASLRFIVENFLSMEFLQKTVAKHIADGGDGNLWLSYKENEGLWRIEYDGEQLQIMELAIELKITSTSHHITLSSGSYRTDSFLYGVSNACTSSPSFVLLKNNDDSYSRTIELDGQIRSLSSMSSIFD